MRTLVRDLKEKVGQEVMLYLTLDVLRDQKHLQFILAHDKTGSIQLVVSKKSVVNHEEISSLLQGSTFVAKGVLVVAEQSKFGMEVQVESIEVLSKAQPLPITQESAIDLRFDYRSVDLRFPRQQLMLKLRSAFLQGASEYLLQNDFIQVNTPKFMKTGSESGAETFKVEYFDTTAYLAQSSQFYKESLVSAGIDNYEISSCFRSEKSTSTRHLTEFISLDVEYAFVFDVKDLMKFEEKLMCYALAKLEPFKDEVKELFGIELTTSPKVKYFTLDEVREIFKEKKGITISKKEDISDEQERLLYEMVGAELIFVSDYPIEKRPFYHMWNREKGTTESFDLIFKGIEITSGSIRQHIYEEVTKQAIEKGLSLESISDYLTPHKLGLMPNHGGFAIGVERVISKLLGITPKECSAFPRDPERLTP